MLILENQFVGNRDCLRDKNNPLRFLYESRLDLASSKYVYHGLWDADPVSCFEVKPGVHLQNSSSQDQTGPVGKGFPGP